MRLLLALFLLTFYASTGFAQNGNGNYIYSHSGQFVVIGKGATLDMYDRIDTNKHNLVALNPHYLAVAAERIKTAFLKELRLTDKFQGRIHIRLLDKAPPTQPIGIISTMFADGWQFELGIPSKVQEEMLIKSLTQALLLEFSNRLVRRSAELPTWVVEGFTQELANSPMRTYLFEAKTLTLEVRGGNELSKAREWLKNNTCLTIDQLSFANLLQSTPEEIRIYQSCAQLLVHELLELPNGRALFASFLGALPHHWNWQTAFLKVYSHQFKTLLEFEKWWALTWLDFRSRGDVYNWSSAVSLERLRSLLLTSMETRMATNSLPIRSEVSLQTMISRTDFSVQAPILKQKVQQLYFAKLNMAPSVAALAGAYEATLQSYVDKRSTAEYQPALRQNENVREQAMTREIIRSLDQLDAHQQNLLANQPASKGIPLPNSAVVQAQKKNKN
ncbi:MAG: hypothetical protein ACO1QB_06280 [Verrucomicrobiales bacterium]